MIVLIPYINLLNLSWIIKCLHLRNMEPLGEQILSFYNIVPFRSSQDSDITKNACILTPLLYPKTWFYRGIHDFYYFCSKTYIMGTCLNCLKIPKSMF